MLLLTVKHFCNPSLTLSVQPHLGCLVEHTHNDGTPSSWTVYSLFLLACDTVWTTLIVGKKGGRENREVLPHKIFFPTFAVLFRIKIFGVSDPDFWKIFWIRSRIGYHFCSSRIRIIQNATLGTLLFFHVLIFSCENFLIT